MSVYVITKESAPALSDFCPESVISDIDKPGVSTLGYFDEDEFLAGILQFCVDNSVKMGKITALITYLFVDETFREDHVATLLLDQLIYTAQMSDINTIEFNLLPDCDSYEELRQFFLKNDFVLEEESFLYSAPALEFLTTPALMRSPKTRSESLSSLTYREFSDMLQKLAPDNSGLSRNLNDYEKNISSCFSDASAAGILLIRKKSHSCLEVVLFAYTGDGAGTRQLDLILSSAKKVREHYPSHTLIQIYTTNPSSIMLINRLCPEIEPSVITHGFFTISDE